MDYQKFIFYGNTTRDAEVKTAESGTTYADFTVAVSPGKERDTAFFPVRAFGKLAEHAEKIKKGDRILVEGRVEISDYTDNEGNQQRSFRVVADTFRRL